MALKKTEIESYKTRLLEMRNQLTHSVKGSADEVKKTDDSSGYSQHQADEGTDDFDRTISLEVTTREYGILKQIDRALEKIDQETYGICDITGNPIPKKRLDAMPYATTTVEAQEKMEKGLL